jgi:hypothetical protein
MTRSSGESRHNAFRSELLEKASTLRLEILPHSPSSVNHWLNLFRSSRFPNGRSFTYGKRISSSQIARSPNTMREVSMRWLHQPRKRRVLCRSFEVLLFLN